MYREEMSQPETWFGENPSYLATMHILEILATMVLWFVDWGLRRWIYLTNVPPPPGMALYTLGQTREIGPPSKSTWVNRLH